MYSVSLRQAAIPDSARQLCILRRSPAGVVDTAAGGLKGSADGTGSSAGFSAIDGMAWLPDSSRLLVDGARLRRITRDGVVQSLTEPLTELQWDQDLMGATVASDGSIHVADFSGRRIHRVDTQGVRTTGSIGVYWAPTGVLATTEGIYVLEYPRAPFGILGDLGVGAYVRVRLIRANGSTQAIARKWGKRTALLAAVATGVVLLVIGSLLQLRRATALTSSKPVFGS